MESMTYQDIKPRPFCPILTYNPVKTQWTHVRYSLSIFGIFPKSAVVNDVREEMFSSLTAQLQEVVDMNVSSATVRHFPVPHQLVPITVVCPDSPSAEQEEATKSKRLDLHAMFGLPLNRPFFRPTNLHLTTDTGPYLLNPHEGLPQLSTTGETAMVVGWYAYHHYMQDRDGVVLIALFRPCVRGSDSRATLMVVYPLIEKFRRLWWQREIRRLRWWAQSSGLDPLRSVYA
jgi:hypothetical protein